MTEREQDLLLYGCHITVEGRRVDPLTVAWEAVESPRPGGKSLVQAVKDAQADAARYRSST